MALALLLTSTAYADELKLSGAQNFAINDEVVKFQVADIDNDGQLDIAYVDANGQLKFAPKESPSDVTELLVGEDVKEVARENTINMEPTSRIIGSKIGIKTLPQHPPYKGSSNLGIH
ncbi:hypothetical protein [Vibrio harveyi]|uniref:hypothetical protein n=1 Tax=Vibrio harveyi TaxID=669 RepID=UPI0002EA1B77|nr:hypothetical protein [Vibrio harveyi]